MFLRDDVIKLMHMKAQFRWSSTILTMSSSPGLHLPAQFCRNMCRAHAACNFARALALAMRTRCSTRMICSHSACSPASNPA